MGWVTSRMLKNFQLQANNRFSYFESTSNKTCRKGNILSELRKCFEEVDGKGYTAAGGRSFWTDIQNLGKYPQLYRFARIFLSIPDSEISQERLFSEVRRRSDGLRSRTKINTLNTDGVLYTRITG